LVEKELVDLPVEAQVQWNLVEESLADDEAEKFESLEIIWNRPRFLIRKV
jgi:hypothetical protein